MSEWTLLVIVALPLLALWIRSIVEVVRRGDYSATQRLTWIVVLVLLPVVGLAAYIVARTPPKPRVSGGDAESSRAEQLVLLAERRQRGELDDVGFRLGVAELEAS